MGKVVLCDTNIAIEFLYKGNDSVQKNLEHIGNDNIRFSIISLAEAVCKADKKNINKIKQFFNQYEVYDLNEGISRTFKGLIYTHFERRSQWIPDALIAATAIHNNIQLYTNNRKDFDFLEGLKLYQPV